MLNIDHFFSRFSLPRPSSASPLLDIFAIIALGGAALLFICLDNDSFFNFWTDRDMLRSVLLLNEFQWMGAELSFGTHARVPGGFLYYIWFIPTIFSEDPDLSYKFCVILAMLSLIPFYAALRASFGAVTGTVACVVLLSSPILFGTLTRLWNPSFQVPFVILAYALLIRLVAEGKVRCFKWLIMCLVLALQMHLSAWLLVLAVLLTIAILRIRIPLREIGWSLVISFALFATYFVGEIGSGWWNTTALISSQGRGAVREMGWRGGLAISTENLHDILRWLALSSGMTGDLPPWPLTTGISWLGNLGPLLGAANLALLLAHWLEWGKPISAAFGVRTDRATRQAVLASTLPITLAIAYYTYSPQIDLFVTGSARYLMFAVPGLAIVAGLGSRALLDATQRSQFGTAVASGLLMIGCATPLFGLVQSLRALDRPDTARGRAFFQHIDVVMRQMDWSLPRAAASTAFLTTYLESEDIWWLESAFAIGYELYRNRVPVPFAADAPCAMYVYGGVDIYGRKGFTPGVIERIIGQPHASFAVDRQIEIGRDLLVVYRRQGGRCPLGTTNRYVLTNEEKVMLGRWGRLPSRSAERLTITSDGSDAFMVNLDGLTYAIIKLHHDNDRLAVELHSNQLRGDSYNGGFLAIGMIESPRLKLRDEQGQTHDIEIESGLVGGRGVFTPIRTVAHLPSGVYDITLEANVFPELKLGTWPVDLSQRRAVRLPLASAVRIGR